MGGCKGPFQRRGKGECKAPRGPCMGVRSGSRTAQGTKAERAGQNKGPSQMPCYITGLFEFTIVKATIVGGGLFSCSIGGRAAGPSATSQVPWEALSLLMRPLRRDGLESSDPIGAQQVSVELHFGMFIIITQKKSNEISSPTAVGLLEVA